MAEAGDPWRLQRFVEAQAPVFEAVRAELAAGRKRTHWMWFVFPQLAGLGYSEMARRYAIASADEARAYLAHPLLGPRLAECAGLMLRTPTAHVRDVLGPPDDLKFRSSMTLFDAVAPNGAYGACLQRFFAGGRDEATVRLLAGG